MSSEALPIAPRAFAAALKDLTLQTLHLKVLELRNSLAHLAYSNEQLRPFAEGAADAAAGADGVPDQDCVDAIRENEEVMRRMEERIALVRAEVEGRGAAWTEFQSKEEAEEMARRGREAGREAAANGTDGDLDGEEGEEAGEGPPAQSNGATTNGAGGGDQLHPAWSDGTFQMGTIRNGEAHLGEAAGASDRPRLTDEELRRAVEDITRRPNTDEDDEGGMHL
jgi:hypothetical protein